MNALTLVWWVSAVGGTLAVLCAALNDRWRRRLLIVAATLFAVAGVLGILSIGVLFLAAAVGCAVAGMRVEAKAGHPVDA